MPITTETITTWTCDRCGLADRRVGADGGVARERWRSLYYSPPPSYGATPAHLLCPSCAAELRAWISRETEAS